MAFRVITVTFGLPISGPEDALCARGWRIDTDCKSFIQLIEWSRIMLPDLSSLNWYIWGLQKREQERQTVIETTHSKATGISEVPIITERIRSNARIRLRHSVELLFITLFS